MISKDDYHRISGMIDSVENALYQTKGCLKALNDFVWEEYLKGLNQKKEEEKNESH